MKGLTAKQSEILNFIVTFIEEHRYSPSYREIMDKFSLSSPGSVYRYIKTLERKGVLTTEKQSHRSMHPLILEKKESATALDLTIPFVGNLSLGYPLELFAQPQTLLIPPMLVHSPDETYALQLQGDSLKEEGIMHGDLLLIEARHEIHAGEMILGIINHKDTVLRRYFPEGQNVRLESQSKQDPSFTIRSEHIMIQGVLVGLLRIY